MTWLSVYFYLTLCVVCDRLYMNEVWDHREGYNFGNVFGRILVVLIGPFIALPSRLFWIVYDFSKGFTKGFKGAFNDKR
jgi:hypothetical protein